MNTYIKSIIASLTCITVIIMLCTGCDSAIRDMKTMSQLQDTLSTRYDASISVSITNGTDISVTLVNSPYNDSTTEVRKRVVKEVAEVTSYVFRKQPQLKVEQVVFLLDHHFMIFSHTESHSYEIPLNIGDTIAKPDTLVPAKDNLLK